jgi:hypothetical protein
MVSSQSTSSFAIGLLKKEGTQGIALNNLYKIYVSAEVNKHRNTFSLEIIDGFLRGNEQLVFSSHQISQENTSIISLDIVNSPKLNTYLKTESWHFSGGNHKILVLVKKQKKAVGFQFIGLDNEIIPESEHKIISKLL